MKKNWKGRWVEEESPDESPEESPEESEIFEIKDYTKTVVPHSHIKNNEELISQAFGRLSDRLSNISDEL